MSTPELSHEDLKLTELSYVKINALLLFMIVPLSIIGYFLAVSSEAMFFVYEWSFFILLLVSFFLAIATLLIYKSSYKWLSYSILAFDLQFAIFGLFMGPYTIVELFFAYYVCSFLALIVLLVTLKKISVFRFLIVVLLIVTGLLTVYMWFLQSLWGVNWM